MMRVSLCEMEELISEGPRIHPPGRIQGGEERRGKGFGWERSANEPNPHSKKLFTPFYPPGTHYLHSRFDFAPRTSSGVIGYMWAGQGEHRVCRVNNNNNKSTTCILHHGHFEAMQHLHLLLSLPGIFHTVS